VETAAAGVTGVELRALAARDCVPDEDHDDRTNNGENPAGDREELVDVNTEDEASEPTTNDGANHAENQSCEPSAALLARQDCLRNSAGDESEKKKCKEAHETAFRVIRTTPNFGGAVVTRVSGELRAGALTLLAVGAEI